MKPPCAAKAAAPVRAGTSWYTPPEWQAFPNRRAVSNLHAGRYTTDRVRTIAGRAGRRAAIAATGADEVTVADAVTAVGRAARGVS